MSPSYADEWAADGFGDGSTPHPDDVDPDAAQGGGPWEDDEPETDSEGNPIEQFIEPPSGEHGEVHLVADAGSIAGAVTMCCDVPLRELPNGDSWTDDRARVHCSWAERGTGDPNRDPAEHEPGSDLEPRQPDAAEVAQSMAAYARAVRDESREHAEHTDGNPRFDPERGVICGCGEVVDEGPDGTAYVPMSSPDSLPAVTAADPVLSDMPPLDPNRHYTPADLERAILEQVRRLDAGLAMQAQWEEVRSRALWAYEKASARARLKVRGGAKDVRDAEVRVACEREADDLAEATMRVEVLKASMHSLRSILSGLQSVGRSVGVLVQAGGGDGQTPYRSRQQQGRQSGPLH